MNRIKFIVLIIVVIAVYYVFVPNEQSVASPDNTNVATLTDDDGVFSISIKGQEDNSHFKDRTSASSFHGGFIKWLDNQTLILESNDIGPIQYIMGPNNSWSKDDPLRALSPNGKMVVYTFWNNSEKHLSINILRASGSESEAFIVTQKLETTIVVSDLINCAIWQSNDEFFINSDVKQYRFIKNVTGTWVAGMANKSLKQDK